MISDELLNDFRVNGSKVKVIRDANPKNDVTGTVVAWSEETVLIRKINRKVVKLARTYTYVLSE